MTAYGYIRQSRRADLDVALSYDAQLGAIHRLAQRDGIAPEDVRILADMGRSGGAGKERLRPAYQELRKAIDAGSVSAVYALSMSRLARSMQELYAFFEAAQEHAVKIVFDKETFDLSTRSGRLTAGMLALVYEFERDLSVERAAGNVAIRRARGDKMGRFPFGDRPGEDPAVVVGAYREAQSYNGAARLLNDRGIVSALGRRWTGTSVRLLIAREARELMPRHPRKGVGGPVSFTLARLLRCSCGRTLTGYHHKAGRIVRYKCHAGEADSSHPRPLSVAETAVMPWIMAEAARYTVPAEVEMAVDTNGERATLEAERAQATRLALVPGVDLAVVQERLAAIDGRLAALEDAVEVEEAGEIDWKHTPPAALNAQLRAYWREVRLDATMRPVEADWRIARMRS